MDKEKKERKNKRLTGSAGEYFVAGELSRRGVTAALTMAGTDAFDILAIDEKKNQYAIQVKTTSQAKPKWALGTKNEEIRDEHIFYVFVKLTSKEDKEKVDYYIVPSDVVATFIRADYERWRDNPGKRGKHDPNNPFREFRIEGDFEEKYHSNWALIGGKEISD